MRPHPHAAPSAARPPARRRVRSSCVAALLAVAPASASRRRARPTRCSTGRARRRPTHEFHGTVRRRVAHGGRLQARHGRRCACVDGVLHMGDDRLVERRRAAGCCGPAGLAAALVRLADGWRRRTRRASTAFDVAGAGRVVAGRATRRSRSSRAAADRVRERLVFDHDDGLLLRRDQFDERGRLMRRVAFVDISDAATRCRATATPACRTRAARPRPRPSALRDVPDDLSAPEAIGDGFVLLGVYAQPDGATQLLLQRRAVRALGVRADGRPRLGRAARRRARHVSSATPGPRVPRPPAAPPWSGSTTDVTYTCVDRRADGRGAERRRAPTSPAADQPSTLEDVGRFVTAPFSWG